MQRSSQLDAPPYDLTLLQLDHGHHDLDLGLRPRSYSNQFLKHLVILRPAIRIARTVFRNRANVDHSGAYRLGPTDRYRKEMRIAKWHIRHRNRAAIWPRRAQFVFRHCDVGIGQRRATNRTKVFKTYHQPPLHAVKIRDRAKRLRFARLRALSVTRVE